MMARTCAVAAIVAVAVAAAAAGARADLVNLYAAPAGVSANSTCTDDKSPCTLERAVDVAYTYASAGKSAVLVNLANGTFAASLDLKAAPAPLELSLLGVPGGTVLSGAGKDTPCVTHRPDVPDGASSNVTLSLLQIRFVDCAGAVSVGARNGTGGGVMMGGTLTIQRSAFVDSVGTAVVADAYVPAGVNGIFSLSVFLSHFTGGSGAVGGAIRASGSVEIKQCGFSGNSATGNGGAIALTGQPAAASSKAIIAVGVSLLNNTCEGNTAGGSGGCLFADFDSADLVSYEAEWLGGSVKKNVAGKSGGGVYVAQGGNSPASFDMTEATVTGNKCGGAGGGVYLSGMTEGAGGPTYAATLTGCTVSGNAGAGAGGGVYAANTYVGLPGKTTVADNTVANSSFVGTGAGYGLDAQLHCDKASVKMGACVACPLTHRRHFVLTGKDAKCGDCFDDHTLAHYTADGKHKDGPYGCAKFTAFTNRTARTGLKKFAVCVAGKGDGLDTCKVLGEDLSFDIADVIGLVALGVATLSIVNCMLRTKSVAGYEQERADKAAANGTAPLLDDEAGGGGSARSSDAGPVQRKGDYGAVVDADGGSVQSF